ncbi:MAG: hypothetical protein ACFFCF_06935 [Promethearchaeota archaeon]
MREPQLRHALLVLCIFIIATSTSSVLAQNGQWVLIGEDYFTYIEPLSGHSSWIFNITHGPNDRWGINCTISGFGFHPATVIICDEPGYHQWIETGNTHQCHFVQAINYSLHTTVDLPHPSQWYFILNNSCPVTLYFSLRLTHYHWATGPTMPPPNPFEGISNLFGYLIIIGLVVFILIPCICRVNCFSLFRWRRNKHPPKKMENPQTIIVVMTPEQLERHAEDDDYY